MAKKIKWVSEIIKLVTDQGVQKAILGEYSDGTTRSFMDCLDGEIISPKDRHKLLMKDQKKGKKKKSKKSKKGKIDL